MLSRQFDIVESLSVSLDKQFFVHAGPEITGNEMFESQRYTTKLVMYEGLRERCSDWINSLLLYMGGPFLEFQIGILTVLIRLTLSSWTLAYSCLYGLAVTFRYDTRRYFNVRSKADISQLNLPHGTDN